MKGEFLAHVSHELRTPMASIQEGTHLLLDEIPGPLSPEQRTTLRIMADSSRRLITLISTILDLSKMDAGMMEYRIVPTDLKRITDMSVNKIRLLADAKHVQLVVEAPAQRVWVKADAIRIEQVLDNLLSNALKFSPEGGIVKTHMKADHKAGVLEVAVSDVGPGIPADELPHIFERFYQGSTKSKHSTPGSGLGLGSGEKSRRSTWRQDLDRERSQEGHDCTLYPAPNQTGNDSMNRIRLSSGGLALVFLATGGCTSWESPAPMSQPYFVVDQGDAKTFHALGKKQDAVTAKCTEHNSCDHAYFTRALIGLYESRDIATKYFEKVIARGS